MNALRRRDVGLAICFCALSGWADAARAQEAPLWGMAPSAPWSSGLKQAVGTAYEAYDLHNGYSANSPTAPLSKVWFTLGQGVLNEIYWPTLDTAQVRDNQILVSDGTHFFVEERKDNVTEVEWVRPGVPAFRTVSKDAAGRFAIEKLVFTDPDRDVVLQRVKITRYMPGLKFYVLHKPAVENTPLGDSAEVRIKGPQAGLFAWQSVHAQAVLFSVPLKAATAGFAESYSDGWQDLHSDYKLDSNYTTASYGNVVLTAQLDLPTKVGVSTYDMAIAFGSSVDRAYENAAQSLASDLDAMLDTYTEQWQTYQDSLRDLSAQSGDHGSLFRASAAVLKASEDKTFAGAFVASPTVPWGNHLKDANAMPIKDRKGDNQTGGYHAVWPRDLFQMATSFMAIDDPKSAIAALNYLRQVQYRNSGELWEYGWRKHSRDGSWGQSLWVNGSARWRGLQMDETAMPLMLAYRLWKAGQIDIAEYWDMVRSGADFIADFGPWSAMERWEETAGASPSNIAAMVAALWTSGEIAHAMKDPARENRYITTADAWSAKPGDNLDTWLFTTSGKHGNGRYFERAEGAGAYDQVWSPEDNQAFTLANGAGSWREKDVIDGGFLELVRYGVRGALNANILETLPEYDATVRYEVPGCGPGFMRYTGDRYNYSDLTGEQTDGMLWPLLTGERGHYELARSLELGLAPRAMESAVDPYLFAIECFATREGMIPEQVWREGPGMGKSTGSATPLGWSHAEYLKLLRSKADHAVFDAIPSVSARRQYLMLFNPSGR